MDIMNSYSDMHNPSCEVVFFYNVNCRFTNLVDGIWVIRDLVARVF